jgi:hypothetical protein
MARISALEGAHARPHFHARYAGQAASIDLDGNPDAGTIAWPNGLDMAPEPLYAEARRHLVQAPSTR